MEILNYEEIRNPDEWLRQMEGCDWRAGSYLYTLLEGKAAFGHSKGKHPGAAAAGGGNWLSFCTYAERDEIPDTELKPWMGFVYTDPEYRGRRLMGKLIARVKELAREDGYDTVYVSTREQGLYEKYGAAFILT